MDYGEANFLTTKYLSKQLLVIASERTVGYSYKFHKKTEKSYACLSCKALGKTRTVTVIDGRIVGKKHPEDDHHEDCRPVPQSSVEVQELDRDMRSVIRKSGKRPREAYMEALTTIPKRFKSTAEQSEIVSAFPTFSEIRGALYRHRSANHIPVPDPCDIPDELRTTMRGKNVGPEDEHFHENFLLYSGQNGKLLVFCAVSELKILCESEFIICDGTFEMAPNSSYQLYTLHGFYHEEGLPLVWALLPNKSRGTYVELFTAIRKAFEERFAVVVGQKRVFVTDFELAAIDAIKEVFPENTVKGCTFHFRQALMRHVADLGLRQAYSDLPVVHDWIRQIMGLTLLPEVFIQLAWSTLSQPPAVADNELMSKMIAFSTYFGKTWITGSFAPALWGHFDNIGPRTTNLAEGWHNSLNHSLRMPHPSARNFLHWLQSCQYEVQCRGIQLQAGRPPKPQSAVYRELNKRIADAKLQFGLRSGSIFVNLFPQQDMWEVLTSEIMIYLRHVSYLIAGKSE
jgi:hypothetical protein